MKHVLLDDGQTLIGCKTKNNDEIVKLNIMEGNLNVELLLTRDECRELARNLLNAVGGSYVQ